MELPRSIYNIIFQFTFGNCKCNKKYCIKNTADYLFNNSLNEEITLYFTECCKQYCCNNGIDWENFDYNYDKKYICLEHNFSYGQCPYQKKIKKFNMFWQDVWKNKPEYSMLMWLNYR